ncbi:21243_t:CDS:2, partial [Racocetra persica]
NSGNQIIDDFLRSTGEQFQWIPYNCFRDIKYLSKGGFGVVYKAKWKHIEVVLKSLYNSDNINVDFLKEADSHKKFKNYNGIVQIYGITRDPFNKNYSIVTKYVSDLILKILDGHRPIITGDTPECFKKLMVRCWNNNPLDRPNINELYKALIKWKNSGNAQFEEAESLRKMIIRSSADKTENMEFIHSETIYTSRLLSNMLPILRKRTYVYSDIHFNLVLSKKRRDFIKSPSLAIQVHGTTAMKELVTKQQVFLERVPPLPYEQRLEGREKEHIDSGSNECSDEEALSREISNEISSSKRVNDKPVNESIAEDIEIIDDESQGWSECEECYGTVKEFCKYCGCTVCKWKGNRGNILLCDGCNEGFHISCLKPQLSGIPSGNWYCKKYEDPNNSKWKLPKKIKQSKSNEDYEVGQSLKKSLNNDSIENSENSVESQ